MKMCESCRYRNNTEYEKPCIIYRDDCEYYEKERGDMNEVGVEIVKTKEAKESGIKYLNINVSNSEVERNPDRVRLCADAGILEYVKTSGDAISRQTVLDALHNSFIDGFNSDKWWNSTHVLWAINNAPSVNPQEPKTGHWKRISIDKYSEHAKYWYRCDRCGKDNLGNTDWCPNCGCRMVEPQERSEKE